MIFLFWQIMGKVLEVIILFTILLSLRFSMNFLAKCQNLFGRIYTIVVNA